jgi:hypothetical protein
MSNDPEGDWHAEPCHPTEHVATDLRFGPLIGQAPGKKTPTNDSFISMHRGFDQAPTIVA